MVAEEVAFPLDGLPPHEALTLFVARARRNVPTFATGAEAAQIAPDIVKICEQLAGLPLGIELAASWVEHIPVAEIGQSLAEIEIAPQQAAGFVSRHHNLNRMLAYSWQLLTESQRRILARLSIFRGGFDRAAAATVANSGLNELSLLIGHSLLQRVAVGRYDLHPLVQEFAARKLAHDQADTFYKKHSQYYLTTLITTERAQRLPNSRSILKTCVVLGNMP